MSSKLSPPARRPSRIATQAFAWLARQLPKRVLPLLLLSVAGAQAQPDLSQKVGPTIVDTGSATYRFDTLIFESTDHARRYRVIVGIPRRAAPAAGYPAIYLLDGNAAIALIDEPLLAGLDAAGPPVIVAVGYDTDLRFDVTARAYDYTPPYAAGAAVDPAALRGRAGGGADLFLALLTDSIMPAVRQRAAIDRERQTLWGHSYGALFVLHTLFTQPQRFRNYIAASPALWWERGAVLAQEKRFVDAGAAGHPHVWIAVGSEERRGDAVRAANPNAAAADPGVAAMLAARAGMPADAAQQLARRLAAVAGVDVHYEEFAGLSHGAMVAASLTPALAIATGIAANMTGRQAADSVKSR